MKYRKKPVEIEAQQYNVMEHLPFGACDKAHNGLKGGVHVHTLEGISYELQNGDWVIQGVKGEFYPIKNDIFLLTYEKVD